MTEDRLIPSSDLSTAYDALDLILDDAESVHIAAAFVTVSGVQILSDLITDRVPPEGLKVVARGAPITQPEALVRLHEEIGAEVAVVMGPEALRFHPKLWLVRAGGALWVLSGSGNLTSGGLRDNHEQFELLRLPRGQGEEGDSTLERGTSPRAEDHERRLAQFWELGSPLADARGSSAWAEWEAQLAAREELRNELADLDLRLAGAKGADGDGASQETDVVAAAKHKLGLLYADAVELYDRTRAEVTIPRKDGGRQKYAANRFKQHIDRAHKESTLVPALAGIVKKPTLGFGHLEAADRPDLTVEALVLDEEKPYHDLFTEQTIHKAQERMNEYYARKSRDA